MSVRALLQRFPAKTIVPFLLVTLVGYLTYFQGYEEPPHFFWDENYHVVSAQKYLNGTFFMEPHPPLGKLLIALGEYLLEANSRNDHFLNTDYGRDLPKGFSFKGYRLFPALLAWLTAPMIYGLFILITKNRIWALCLSGLYLFDNALIVHNRGAMLDSAQIFFIVATLLAFFLLLRALDETGNKLRLAFLFGLAFGGAILVKVNSLVLVLLYLPLLLRTWTTPRAFIRILGASLGGALVVYVAVWQIHFSIATNVVPELQNQGYYRASPAYKTALKEGRTSSPLYFPVMLSDSFDFLAHYQKGVAKLNLCKMVEDGSPYFLWPFGARTINYRWERHGKFTRYLYLVSNPLGWTLGLVGVVLGTSLVLVWLFFPGARKTEPITPLLTLLMIYWGYMFAVSQIERVMYLYHYFIPLILSYLIFGVMVREVRWFMRWPLSERVKTVGLSCLGIGVLASFWYMRPLTYYLPMTDRDVRERALLDVWDLRPTKAKLTNRIAKPLCDPNVKDHMNISLANLKVVKAYQEWGDPKFGASVIDRKVRIDGKPYSDVLGVHARSSLKLRLGRRYERFRVKAGLPDYTAKMKGKQASVVFTILGDGKELWSSGLVRPLEPIREADLSVKGFEILELTVTDGGDGNNNDHGCWIDSRLD